MKRALLLVLVLFFISTSLLAQKMNVVKTDLFSPILRTGTLKYERAFTEDIAVQLGFFYTGFHPFDSETTVRGYGITPEFRFYLSTTPAPNGTYFYLLQAETTCNDLPVIEVRDNLTLLR